MLTEYIQGFQLPTAANQWNYGIQICGEKKKTDEENLAFKIYCISRARLGVDNIMGSCITAAGNITISIGQSLHSDNGDR